jgi:hypothetical protein
VTSLGGIGACVHIPRTVVLTKQLQHFNRSLKGSKCTCVLLQRKFRAEIKSPLDTRDSVDNAADPSTPLLLFAAPFSFPQKDVLPIFAYSRQGELFVGFDKVKDQQPALERKLFRGAGEHVCSVLMKNTNKNAHPSKSIIFTLLLRDVI